MKTIEEYLYEEIDPSDISQSVIYAVFRAMNNVTKDSYNQAIQDVSHIVGLVNCGEIDYDKLSELIKD